jgi:hypothetical protein
MARVVGDQCRGDCGARAAPAERDPAAAETVELLGVAPAVLLGVLNHVHHSLLCDLC